MSEHMRTVRGAHGPLPVHDRGVTIQQIKEWRAIEFDAGRPNSLDDFYSAHQLCKKCRGEGVCMIGWSQPVNADEFQATQELNLEELPLYAVCPLCGGTGRVM